MALAYDIARATVLSIIAVLVHLIAVELLAPGGILYGVATDGTAVMNGAARAGLWFQILSVWVPLGVFAFAWLWVFVRMFRRQVTTGAARAPRP